MDRVGKAASAGRDAQTGLHAGRVDVHAVAGADRVRFTVGAHGHGVVVKVDHVIGRGARSSFVAQNDGPARLGIHQRVLRQVRQCSRVDAYLTFGRQFRCV